MSDTELNEEGVSTVAEDAPEVPVETPPAPPFVEPVHVRNFVSVVRQPTGTLRITEVIETKGAIPGKDAVLDEQGLEVEPAVPSVAAVTEQRVFDTTEEAAMRFVQPWLDAGGVIEDAPEPSPRELAVITKTQFGQALVGAGILSLSDGIKVMNGEWPSAFDPFLYGDPNASPPIPALPDAQILAVMGKWIDATSVPRLDPLVAQLGEFAWPGDTDAEREAKLDILFGV